MNHKKFFKLIQEECKIALIKNEVPIACLAVCNNKIITKAHNETNLQKTPLAHAELIILKKLINFENIIFYVNVEPCGMCMGILKEYNIKVFYCCKNYIFGGNTVFNIDHGTFVNDDSDFIYMLKHFYCQENINAPEEIRKCKNRKKLKWKIFGIKIYKRITKK